MSCLIDAHARGVFPISVTPFADDGAIDLASMDRLVEFFVELGVPGITVLGVLGEASRLSGEEAVGLARYVLKRAAGRFRVIVGAAHGGFDPFADFTRAVMDAGAAGIMVAPPTGLRTEDQVIGYVEGLAGRIGPEVPLVLQDYPQLTGVFMSADTLDRLLRRVPSIQVVKHEEGSALRKITRLRAQEGEGGRRRVAILVGNSALHLPQELRRGIDGANTGVAFPEMLIEVCERFWSGREAAGEDLYDTFLPLIRHEWQPGIGLALRKEVFRRRGLIQSARTRAPGPALDATDHEELTRILARLMQRLEQTGEAGLIRSYPLADAA